MYTNILWFLLCAALITFSGTQLSKYGNQLADLTGLSKAWIGLILMATVTSLPELVTGLSAVIVVEAPDLAAGNILGSCVFNLLILSLLDVMVKKPITSLVKPSHLVAGSFGIMLLASAGVAIVLATQTTNVLWFSPFTPVLLLLYFASMRGIFLHEKSQSETDVDRQPASGTKSTIRKALFIYCLHALIVISAALFLPYFGENIAQQTGLSDSFFGTLFLAITTSLPEFVISISALRIGALDMAMGNLMGSNVFNIFVLGICDLFYTSGSFYAAISQTHLLSILASIVMTAVVAIGLIVRPEKKIWRLSLDTFTILIIYILLMFTLK
ncbi:MAG: sodium:calcium antiporter [Cyclobacteriaceae bacterium]|nr:sodium:calcium antiporter [Cyclobacteriaceae bacterium]